MLNSKIRPRAVVGYGVKIFHPSPPNYVTRSPGVMIIMMTNEKDINLCLFVLAELTLWDEDINDDDQIGDPVFLMLKDMQLDKPEQSTLKFGKVSWSRINLP